jgi:hypothetical protein
VSDAGPAATPEAATPEAATPEAATSVARAIDELRRGQVVRVTSPKGELADESMLARLEAGGRAGLVVTPRRAAVLHIVNQRPAAGGDIVWIERPDWLDLAATVAIADPGDDLRLPFKGPFRPINPEGRSGAARAGGPPPPPRGHQPGGGGPSSAASCRRCSRRVRGVVRCSKSPPPMC